MQTIAVGANRNRWRWPGANIAQGKNSPAQILNAALVADALNSQEAGAARSLVFVIAA